MKGLDPPLSEAQLQEIRSRKDDPMQFHDVRLAQRDRELLLAHVEWLRKRVTNLQRSL